MSILNTTEYRSKLNSLKDKATFTYQPVVIPRRRVAYSGEVDQRLWSKVGKRLGSDYEKRAK